MSMNEPLLGPCTQDSIRPPPCLLVSFDARLP